MTDIPKDLPDAAKRALAEAKARLAPKTGDLQRACIAKVRKFIKK